MTPSWSNFFSFSLASYLMSILNTNPSGPCLSSLIYISSPKLSALECLKGILLAHTEGLLVPSLPSWGCSPLLPLHGSGLNSNLISSEKPSLAPHLDHNCLYPPFLPYIYQICNFTFIWGSIWLMFFSLTKILGSLESDLSSSCLN